MDRCTQACMSWHLTCYISHSRKASEVSLDSQLQLTLTLLCVHSIVSISNMSDAAAPAAAPAPKSPAKPKAKKPAAKKGPGAGKYQTMIVAAITALKDRTGSSVPAINKYIGANFKKDLSTGWEKTVAQVLKRFAASGKVVKVKASYKVRGAAPWCALAAAPWPVCTACLVAHTCCTFLAMSRCAAGSRQQLVGPLVQVVGRYICV